MTGLNRFWRFFVLRSTFRGPQRHGYWLCRVAIKIFLSNMGTANRMSTKKISPTFRFSARGCHFGILGFFGTGFTENKIFLWIYYFCEIFMFVSIEKHYIYNLLEAEFWIFRYFGFQTQKCDPPPRKIFGPKIDFFIFWPKSIFMVFLARIYANLVDFEKKNFFRPSQNFFIGLWNFHFFKLIIYTLRGHGDES